MAKENRHLLVFMYTDKNDKTLTVVMHMAGYTVYPNADYYTTEA